MKTRAQLSAERREKYAPIREKIEELFRKPGAPVTTFVQLAEITSKQLKENVTDQSLSRLWRGEKILDDRFLQVWSNVFKVKPEFIDSEFQERASLVGPVPLGDDQPGVDPVRIEAVKRVVEEFRQAEPTLLQGKQWDTLVWKLEGAARDPDVGLTLDNVRQEAVSLLRMYASKLLS